MDTGTEVKLTADFLLETMQVKSQWNNSFKVLKTIQNKTKIKTVYLEFYTQKKSISKMKVKKRLSEKYKIQNNSLPADSYSAKCF